MQDTDGDFIRLQDPSAILLYSFLQNSSNCAFQSELEKFISYDSDLGDLQTDGNVVGQFQVQEPVPDEEIFRIIGAQLAEIGDILAVEIEAPFINSLAQNFMAENMSKEEVARHLSEAVLATVQRIPLEMEQEKAMLIIAMLLAKKVADAVPSVLGRVFRTAVDYINSNLGDYVENLAPER